MWGACGEHSCSFDFSPSVVLPDCLGPVTEITGLFNDAFCRFLCKVIGTPDASPFSSEEKGQGMR